MREVGWISEYNKHEASTKSHDTGLRTADQQHLISATRNLADPLNSTSAVRAGVRASHVSTCVCMCVCVCVCIQGRPVVVHLRDIWADLPAQPGDPVNLLCEVTEGADGQLHATCCSAHGMVVLHPDVLISGKGIVFLLTLQTLYTTQHQPIVAISFCVLMLT